MRGERREKDRLFESLAAKGEAHLAKKHICNQSKTCFPTDKKFIRFLGNRNLCLFGFASCQNEIPGSTMRVAL